MHLSIYISFRPLAEGQRLDEQEDLPAPPAFVRKPDSAKVEEGGTVKFMIRITGNPIPDVIWTSNGEEILPSSRFRLTYDGMMHYLEIAKCKPLDTATLEVIAQNHLGKVSANAELEVIPQQNWRSQLKNVKRKLLVLISIIQKWAMLVFI